MRNFNFLASLCSCGDWFESRFVGNLKDRFCYRRDPLIDVKKSARFMVILSMINGYPLQEKKIIKRLSIQLDPPPHLKNKLMARPPHPLKNHECDPAWRPLCKIS